MNDNKDVDSAVFVGDSFEKVYYDLECWKKQFDECCQYETCGYSFCLVKDQTVKRIVLYVEHSYYYDSINKCILEMTAIETFADIPEAQRVCSNIISRYINEDMIDGR